MAPVDGHHRCVAEATDEYDPIREDPAAATEGTAAAAFGLWAVGHLVDLPAAFLRFWLGWLVGWALSVGEGIPGLADNRLPLACGLVLALGPPARGLAAWGFDLSPGPLWRLARRLRRPTLRQRGEIEATIDEVTVKAGVVGIDVTPPRTVRISRSADGSASVLGRLMVVHDHLLETPTLAPVVAHELGHLATMDARSSLAEEWHIVASIRWIGERIQPGPPAARYRAAPFPARAVRALRSGVGWLLLLAGGSVLPQVLNPARLRLSRLREHTADEWAAAAGYSFTLAAALTHLSHLYDESDSWWNTPHPSTAHRIDRLRAYEP